MPDEQLLTTAGRQIIVDAANMATAVAAQIAAWQAEYVSAIMTEVASQGPQGGLIGATCSVTVELVPDLVE